MVLPTAVGEWIMLVASKAACVRDDNKNPCHLGRQLAEQVLTGTKISPEMWETKGRFWDGCEGCFMTSIQMPLVRHIRAHCRFKDGGKEKGSRTQQLKGFIITGKTWQVDDVLVC